MCLSLFSFFILLRGSVSVFISENKGGDEALDIGQRTLGRWRWRYVLHP